MNKLKRISIAAFLIILIVSCQVNKNSTKEKLDIPVTEKTSAKTEVLLIGTFHFASFEPGNNHDVMQTSEVDVLTDQNQKELELITKKIVEFNPSKIFVEYPSSLQSNLDEEYKNFIPSNYKQKERSEGDQLAYRVAKTLGHSRVYGCDYRNFSFPYTAMLKTMKNANQSELIKLDEEKDENWEKSYNEIVNKNQSLLDVLYFLNSEEERYADRGWYLNFANKAGTLKDTIGTYLASEWSKRNLHIYSTIQKQVGESDERIMILLGSSHIAILKDFIDYNPEWKTVELKEIMENN